MIRAKYISDTPPKKGREGKSGQNVAWYFYDIWRRMSKEDDNKWGNLHIVAPDEQADIYIVVNHPVFYPPYDYFDPAKTIVLQLEPPCARDAGWMAWENPDHDDFLFVHDIKTCKMNIDWNVNQTYRQLSDHTPEKTKLFSTIQTWKAYHPGHKLRHRFLKTFLNGFKGLDIYGNLKQGDDFLYENYKGLLPVREKELGIMPYKYHFCCENSEVDNYFTEKICDALVCEALPLYWGCPNLDKFLPEDCYIRLPLDDPERSLEVIRKAIEGNEWEKRLPAIREAKRRILNELQMFPTLDKILSEVL